MFHLLLQAQNKFGFQTTIPLDYNTGTYNNLNIDLLIKNKSYYYLHYFRLTSYNFNGGQLVNI